LYSQKFLKAIQALALTFAASLPSLLAAQVTTSQAKGSPNAPAPRWDVFAGYSLLDPRGTFYPIQPDGSVLPVSFKLEKTGLLESAAYYFNRNVGIVVEGGEHDLFTNTGFAATGSSNSGILTLQSGLIYRWPGVHLTPFVHGLGGGAYVDGPDHEPYTWGPVITGGGGLDWYFGCHGFGVRLFEADYEFFHANSGLSHGTLAGDDFVWGDDENVSAIRFASGIVFRGASYYNPVVGCGPIPPPALTCVATPNTIFPGDPVTVTASASGLNPKESATYSWSGVGAVGSGEVANVATGSLAPGTYTVKARVTESGKHPQSSEAECGFTVTPWLPPACTVQMQASVEVDKTAAITLSGTSPQNRPLQYSCSSQQGKVEMTGNTAVFNPGGAPEGPVTINCTVNDDKGQTASCNSTVTIAPIPSPPVHHVIPLCSIDFNNDKRQPERVDNEAKACLDAVALALQQHPDQNLVIVGEAATSAGENVATVGAQRAVNTKHYLAAEKGIDPARITVVTGIGGTKGVDHYLVPLDANFGSDVPNTTPVDENVVKPQVREVPPTRSHTAPRKPAVTKKPAASAPVTAAPATNAPAKPMGAKKKPVHHMKKPAGATKPAASQPATKGTDGP
jgi:outer membrane protein OmpA-like peptidoglycan-associated protein